MKNIQKNRLFWLEAIFVIAIVTLVMVLISSPGSSTPSSGVKIRDGVQPDAGTTETAALLEKMVSVVSVSRQQDTGMIRFFGLTGLPTDSRVVFEIRPADIETRKKTAEDIDGITGRTSISGKDGLKGWLVDINMTFWRTGKYIINVWPEQSDPRYGDMKAFFVPLNDTIVNGAGKESASGEIILNEIFPSEQSSFPVSVTPEPTPETR